ncbi:GNAT family N-acetyltransferase [Rossellomorea aquimaris]|jgi:Acetyltransferase (GNAT) domain|uniref:N-acetyltransferase domain-containing protein n=1 Tax=Rossellomorea aquimaris TaxID=189382 RepID=A0A1J6WVC4_9BACI|nr:GNAT family N-acetyltransferase [Rossellomorea aquimaris]OIU69817.1 hypothetical protein BHE18_02600 [Rossellomorea aquimaris]
MLQGIFIEHFEHEHIEDRISLLYDYHIQKNLNHLSMQFDRNKIRELHEDSIENNQDSKRYYVIKTNKNKIVGYCWISSIDWINRTCELSIGILPEYRIGYGLLALVKMYDYLYDQLNMKTVLNQILEGNELLRSKVSLDGLAIKIKGDSFTAGKVRNAYMWTQTKEEHELLGKEKAKKNKQLNSKFKEVMSR